MYLKIPNDVTRAALPSLKKKNQTDKQTLIVDNFRADISRKDTSINIKVLTLRHYLYHIFLENMECWF